jgi:peptide/nickel transport system permease protein
VVRVSVSLPWLGRRLALSLFAAYLVVSVAFGFVALTPDPNEGAVAYEVARQTGGNDTAVAAALADYREARDRDEPVVDRYLAYLENTATLQWGVSFSRGRPVSAVVADALPVTGRYVALALVFSTVGGLALGVYGAFGAGSLGDRTLSVLVYGLFGLANFYVVAVPPFDTLTEGSTMRTVLGPALLLSTTLLAGQLRYARATSLEYLERDFVKLVRATGGGTLRVARHVARNVVVPLLSLFFSELFAVLVLEAFVIEAVFGLPGLASVTLDAVNARDLPLVVGVTVAVAFAGISANFLQDLAHRLLDPRAGDEVA